MTDFDQEFETLIDRACSCLDPSHAATLEKALREARDRAARSRAATLDLKTAVRACNSRLDDRSPLAECFGVAVLGGFGIAILVVNALGRFLDRLEQRELKTALEQSLSRSARDEAAMIAMLARESRKIERESRRGHDFGHGD